MISSVIGSSWHVINGTVIIFKFDTTFDNRRIPRQKSSFVSLPVGHLLSMYCYKFLNLEITLCARYCVEITLWLNPTQDSDFLIIKQISFGLEKKKKRTAELSLSTFIYELGIYELCPSILKNNESNSRIFILSIFFFFVTVVKLQLLPKNQ